ncbi:chemotaxis protein MotB [Bdellovibrio sp. SKB1291214]|uniref:flagellar motor protein MotB n=1 Tax=Bdellovibrio sp. SKB1291214 TaxID=1732569 RepID=UPI000B514DEE|nr:flagellar motor protein MotB [Bdellovibrio sp. SKB1291214]UYL10000.1 chemotaxis protein MotB [Bdellovibrio sp. SKB1291214]
MAEKKQTIVIKKIIVQGGGGHGGSWKVALADFMTALMAFFLVMWIVGQSDQTKKAVSDYFSTPSVIEYNFQNFGVELTLEKLFLDLLNEPLKAFQSFMEPMDKTPNLLDMGSAKVVAAYMADQMNDVAKNVVVTPEGFDFDIPDYMLFERGTSQPNANFVQVMDKIKGVTAGLKDAEIKLTSGLFVQSVPDSSAMTANRVASQRLDIVRNKVSASLESSTVTVSGAISVKEKLGEVDPKKLVGFIKVKIAQKELTSDGRKQRKLESMFGEQKVDMSVYDNFVHQVSTRRKEEAHAKKPLKQQVDDELKDAAKSPSSLTE